MIKKISISILTLISAIFFSPLSSEPYLLKIDSVNNNIIVNQNTSPIPPESSIKPYIYMSEFNLSAIGSGTYIGNDYVTVPYSEPSKPTFIGSEEEANEIRFKIKSFGSNFRNQLHIRDSSTNKAFVLWYNDDNLLYFYDNNSVLIKTFYIGTNTISDVMEFRINFINKNIEFYINNDIKYSGAISTSTFPSSVYAVIYDWSASKTPTQLLPE